MGGRNAGKEEILELASMGLSLRVGQVSSRGRAGRADLMKNTLM